MRAERQGSDQDGIVLRFLVEKTHDIEGLTLDDTGTSLVVQKVPDFQLDTIWLRTRSVLLPSHNGGMTPDFGCSKAFMIASWSNPMS